MMSAGGKCNHTGFSNIHIISMAWRVVIPWFYLALKNPLLSFLCKEYQATVTWCELWRKFVRVDESVERLSNMYLLWPGIADNAFDLTVVGTDLR